MIPIALDAVISTPTLASSTIAAAETGWTDASLAPGALSGIGAVEVAAVGSLARDEFGLAGVADAELALVDDCDAHLVD